MSLLKIPPLEKDFEKAEKLFFHDRFVEKVFLWAIPQKIYPNHLTILRMFSIPFVFYLVYSGEYFIGLFVFLISAFTDVLDGSLARTRNQITAWGKIYDPIADKFLIGTMVYVIVLRYIDPLTAYLILFLEVVIIITGSIRLRLGFKVQANVWGKIKMFLQVLGVTALLLSVVFDIGSLLPFINGTFYLAIAFAIISLFTYGI